MRVYGWCQHCKRFKLVRVTVMQAANAPMQIGICADCEEEGRS